jgi:uncharacterized protein (DUF302 family)
MDAALGFEVPLESEFSEAIEQVLAALKVEGFGVLSRIDVDQALKEKIGVDFRSYAILGACNPQLAHRALQAAPEVGLLLPCNVTVEAVAGGGSLVRIINPREMMAAGGFDDDERVRAVGEEAYVRLRRVAEALRSAA